MNRYVVPDDMLEDYKHFIDAVINTKPHKDKISITNSFTADGRKTIFILEAYEENNDDAKVGLSEVEEGNGK